MAVSNPARDNLLDIAKAYAKAKDLSLRTVSKKFHGRTKFLADFATGKSTVGLIKLDEMIEAFRREWPDGIPWPAMRPITMDGKSSPKK